MFLGPWCGIKKTQKSHLLGDLKPTRIAIDLGGWFRQNRGPKSIFQEVQPTGGQAGSVRKRINCIERGFRVNR